MHSPLESAKRCRGCQRHVALSWIKQQARALRALLTDSAGVNASHDTWLCQFENAPAGLSFHAHTCNVSKAGNPTRLGLSKKCNIRNLPEVSDIRLFGRADGAIDTAEVTGLDEVLGVRA